MLGILALTLGLSQPAAAGPYSLDVVNGSILTDDPRWNIFSDRDALTGWGLRAGYAVNSNLSGVVGWQWGPLGFVVADDVSCWCHGRRRDI